MPEKNQTPSNGRGGARKGAGRKAGSATIKTREIANGAAAAGLTPLEYMLEVMRRDSNREGDDVTTKFADVICQRLAEGESLNAICKTKGYPAESTVRAWALDDRNGFSAKYARAREIGYDRLAEEILAIADTPRTGTKSVSKATGLEVTEGDMIEHRRLQVEARKWMLSKMLPKRYGDKLELAGELTVKRPATELTDDELAAIATGKRNADA